MKDELSVLEPDLASFNNGFRTIRRRPVDFVEEDRPLFAHEFEKTFPPAEIRLLRNVDISGGSILSQGTHVLAESFSDPVLTAHWQTPKSRLKLFLLKLLFARREVIDHGIWFTDTRGHEFFHWMADSLPRLLLVPGERADLVALLPGIYEGIPYVAASLKTFGIGRIEYIHCPSRCRRLTLSPMVAPSGNYHDALLQSLRAHFHAHIATGNDTGFGERIYVSRERAPRRRVVGEPEVIELLESFGFRTVCFEDFDFDHQVTIAAAARRIVSIHGAGLAHMLSMASGGKVLEFRKQDDDFNNCYFSMASALGHDYFYQLCEATDPTEKAFSANLIVDLARLRENLELMEKY